MKTSQMIIVVLKAIAAFGLGISIICLVNFGASAQEKLKPEDIITKHLETFGSSENRAAERSRILAGKSLLELKTGGRGQAEGTATISSQNGAVYIDANFESPDFPFERISFDGKKADVRQYKPGSRSPIGDYILSNDELLKEGLIGGVLSSNWALLHLAERKPRLRYEGIETIDGRSTHKLRYEMKKGSDVKIRLYFDAETYRHVRTDFEQSIAAQMGNRIDPRNQESGQLETRFKMVERYSDFASTGGLDLPKKYTIEYSVFSRNSPLLIEWTFNFSRYAFNQPLELGNFTDAKK
jgi:hypothetical protein